MEKAVELGAEEIHFHAQTHAADFYRRFGFTAYGDIYLEAGIKHVSMMKKV